MINVNSKTLESGFFAGLRLMAAGLIVLLATGCGPGSSDGTAFTSYTLPTDLILRLRCEDVGIYLEGCVLEDVENPYRNVATGEFDENNPFELPGKFQLFAEILEQEVTLGVSLAKAKFYLWATALARRSSGENQFYTALALHELWAAQKAQNNGWGDPLVRRQAAKAYRSVLDNYFGSTTFFGPFGDPPAFVSFQLNLLVGDNLYREAATGYPLLLPVQDAELLSGDFFPENFEAPPDASAGDVLCTVGWACFNDSFTTSNLYMPGGTVVNPPARSEFGGTQMLKQFGPDAIASRTVPVTAGETYTASVYAMNWVGDEFNNLALLQLTFLDSGGNQIGQAFEVFADTVGGANVRLAPTAGNFLSDWTRLSVQGSAPPGTVSAKLLLQHIDIGGGGGSIFWDDASLFGPPPPTPLLAQSEINTQWGYTYIPCTIDCPNDGFLYVNE